MTIAQIVGVALVIHDGRETISAVLQNDTNGGQELYSVLEWTQVIPDTRGPTAKRGRTAMEHAGVAHEQEEVTDVMRQLQVLDGGGALSQADAKNGTAQNTS